MDYCHRHNLVDQEMINEQKPFGIRVTLPPGDTFQRLLGEDWEKLHWYASEVERDAAYEQMDERHGYYRRTDNPTQVLEKIKR